MQTVTAITTPRLYDDPDEYVQQSESSISFLTVNAINITARSALHTVRSALFLTSSVSLFVHNFPRQ